MDIDVIIPCYNGEAFVERCITSIMNQSILPKRVLLIDDGSTDNSPEIVRDLQSKFQSLELHSQENRGLSSARNLGIKVSTSDLIAFLDVDDYWLPNKLAHQLGLIQGNLEIYPFAITSNYFLERNGIRTLGISNPPNRPINSKNLLKFRSVIPGSGSAVLLPKQIISHCGYFDEDLRYGEDLDYWIRISKEFLWLTSTDRDVVIFENEHGIQGNMKNDPEIFKKSSIKILEKSSSELKQVENILIRSYIEFHTVKFSRRFGTFDLKRLIKVILGLFYGVSVKCDRLLQRFVALRFS
jgi:glycosyltransferase involved in cell wall biosynthesis